MVRVHKSMKRFFIFLACLTVPVTALAADDESCLPVRQAITKMIEAPAYSIYPVRSGVRSRTPSLEVGNDGVFVTEKGQRKKIGERDTFRIQMKKIMGAESLTGCKNTTKERVDRVNTIVYGYLSREGPERVWIGAEDGRVYRIRNGQGEATKTTAVVYQDATEDITAP